MCSSIQSQQMKNKCFWSHNWSKWELIEKGDITRETSGTIAGKFIFQKRKCEDCNKEDIEMKKITI